MDKNTSLVIVGFVALLLAAVFISTAADTGNQVTNLLAANETINIAPARLAGGAINETYAFYINNAITTGWRQENSECAVTTINFKNVSGTTLVDPSQYVFTNTIGRLTLKNVPALNQTSSNITTVSYNYCPDNYLASSFGRAGINTTYGLFAIGALMVAVGIFFQVGKNNGLWSSKD